MKLPFDEYLSLPFYHPGMSGLIPASDGMLFSVADIAMFFYLRLHSSYAFFIRAYTHVKVEFALHPTYEITKFIKGQHSVLCMI